MCVYVCVFVCCVCLCVCMCVCVTLHNNKEYITADDYSYQAVIMMNTIMLLMITYIWHAGMSLYNNSTHNINQSSRYHKLRKLPVIMEALFCPYQDGL